MKRIIKVLALLMCLFITISCTACAPTKGVGLMASKILLNSEYNVQISTVNYLGSVIEFKEEAILLNATTNLTKPIKMILLKNNEDFKNVKEKINEIIKELFGNFSDKVYYKTDNRNKTVIFAIDKSVLNSIEESEGDSNLAEIINNLSEAKYSIQGTQFEGCSRIVATKYLLQGVQKNLVIEFYEEETDLQEAYETYLELYSEDIEKGEILLEKKKNLIIKASSKYALEDALGK